MFEKMLQEFDDDKIGELEDHEVDAEAGVPASTYTHLCDDFIEKQKKDWGVKPEDFVQVHVTSYVSNYVEETEEQTKVEIDRLTWRPERNRWDCESVISTYSNMENHPRGLKMKKIKPTKQRIELRKGRPSKFDYSIRPGTEKESDLGIIFEDDEKEGSEDEMVTVIDLPNKRERNESPEERKRRKRLVKAQRRMARQQKRSLKKAFKEEKKLQEKMNVAMKLSHSVACAI